MHTCIKVGFWPCKATVKGQTVCWTFYGDMQYKDLLGTIASVGYCILVPDFYLLLHILCIKSTIIMGLINQSINQSRTTIAWTPSCTFGTLRWTPSSSSTLRREKVNKTTTFPRPQKVMMSQMLRGMYAWWHHQNLYGRWTADCSK